jgi:multicomponent Na+:H+ antiporter subunit F
MGETPMGQALTVFALVILLAAAGGIIVALRKRVVLERMMAVQLLGTGGAAALLLLSAVSAQTALVDVAVLLVLLSAFSCMVFTLGEDDSKEEGP